ncbi:MAG: tRNA uridine-5-carboxymethylaminomethyl(34) synthesis GTPase MnmE [Elusimicrobiota bacterium]
MSDVIAALATPPGRGALGIVRLSGGGARALARALLAGAELPARHPVLRTVFDGGKPLDRALVTYFPAASSSTGEDAVEFSAHGSPWILERLLALCREAGARPARPGEFTQRAYLNGRLDLSQAEAVADLIAARSRRAHRGAMLRLEGGLSRETAALRAVLLDALAPVEAAVDHPEGEVAALSAESLRRALARARERLFRTAAAARRGRILSAEPRIAILGRPNAGKSSLLNALLGRERAIVSPLPGTTRDTLEAACDLDGLPAVLVDTAGLREDGVGAVEAEGRRRAEAELAGCDAALVVLDRAASPGPQRALLERVAREGRPAVAALNKCDLPAGLTTPAVLSWTPGLPVVEVSALRGEGLEALASGLRAAAVPADDAGEPWAFGLGERHLAALEEALKETDAACARAAEPELAAAHLRAALDALDELCGRTTREDVLSAVFAHFCVGK